MAMTLAGSSCKKEKLLETGGELYFSTDTLTFDTVFTSVGSATVGVKIFNPQAERIVISSIRLAGGSSSFFNLNVDGKSGPGENIEIAGKDSVYVFATVKIDPTDENSPFVVEDKLIATLNGKEFSIPVMAYGQNAYYIHGEDGVSLRSQIFKTDKPYVMIGYVEVDTAEELIIPEGCRIYMHANARLIVAGKLTALGTKKDSIIFQGDRLDRSYFGYEGYPGEWGGLYFRGISSGSILEHVVIKNCGNSALGAPPAAIQLEPYKGSGTQLTMNKTVIENSFGYGILAFDGNLKATNCLIHSCGASAIGLVQGGEYELNNCTIAVYGNNKISHNENPAALILNFYEYAQDKYYVSPLSATLTNCVIAGSLENEFVADSLADAGAQIKLTNCLLKGDQSKVPSWVLQTNVSYTTGAGTSDSLFADVSKMNYRPKAGSPLIDKGIVIPGISPDMDENHRDGLPDIGCYEFIK